MNKQYFIEKLDDLKNLHQNKFKNIEDILEKCNKHEMEIYEKIKYLNEDPCLIGVRYVQISAFFRLLPPMQVAEREGLQQDSPPL